MVWRQFNNTSPIHVTLLCPQLVLKHHTDVYPLRRLKIIQMLLPPTKPHHSFSPHQPQSGKGYASTGRHHPPSLAFILASHPSLDSARSVHCVESWWQVHDGSCRKSRKAERGVSKRTRQRHHMISQHEFCFRACRLNINTRTQSGI